MPYQTNSTHTVHTSLSLSLYTQNPLTPPTTTTTSATSSSRTMPAQHLPDESTILYPPPEVNDDPKQQDFNNVDNNTIKNDEPQPQQFQADSDEISDSEPSEKNEFVMVKFSEIRKEVQCPICLGIIQKTRTVMECLHRFCRGCIDKAMRLGNNECPACRTHCASRRSLRDDPNYDALIAALCPDINKYEEKELAFHEEEKARNILIQAAITETVRRQTEALGRKRTTARAAAAEFFKRSPGSYGNFRGRKNHRIAEDRGSDDEEDGSMYEGGNSCADERSTEVRPRRRKKCMPLLKSRQSLAIDDDASYHDNDVQVKRESLGGASGLLGSFEILSWGKSGIRSQHRSPISYTGKGNSQISKLINYLSCADQNIEGLDISLTLVTLHEDTVPSLQRPYICSRPALSVNQLCQYIALHTSMQADEIEMLLIKDLELTTFPSYSIRESQSLAIDASKCEMHLLEQHQTLAEIQSLYIINQQNLVLAYRRKTISLAN